MDDTLTIPSQVIDQKTVFVTINSSTFNRSNLNIATSLKQLFYWGVMTNILIKKTSDNLNSPLFVIKFNMLQAKDKLQMEECSESEPRQRWQFQSYDSTKEEKS